MKHCILPSDKFKKVKKLLSYLSIFRKNTSEFDSIAFAYIDSYFFLAKEVIKIEYRVYK